MCALNDKVIIVTGGSSGIGRAEALSFAKRGAKVIITARRAAPLEETASDHPNIIGLVADAAAPDDAARTISKAVDTWGHLDVLVNNAGAGAILPLADVTADRIMKIFAVNVVGPSLLAAAALPYLSAAKGTIINVSSTFGHKPVAGLSHYAASKAALEHLTRCWALELAPHGVRVNAIAAGPTESGALTGMMGLSPEQAATIKEQERDRIPLKRRGNPDDVARWIVSLADPVSEWVTGQVIAVDGGPGSHNRNAQIRQRSWGLAPRYRWLWRQRPPAPPAPGPGTALARLSFRLALHAQVKYLIERGSDVFVRSHAHWYKKLSKERGPDQGSSAARAPNILGASQHVGSIRRSGRRSVRYIGTMRYRRVFVSGGRFFHRGDIKSATAIRLCGTFSAEPSLSGQSDKGEALYGSIAARTSRLGSMLGTGRGDPAR